MTQDNNIHDVENMDIGSEGGNFNFSHISLDDLGGQQYTVAVMATDISGSTSRFEDVLLKLAQNVVLGLQKSPVADMVLLRSTQFNYYIKEVHGFVPVSSLKPDSFKKPHSNGGTNLYGSAQEALKSIEAMGNSMYNKMYEVVGLFFHITDGEDTSYSCTPAELARIKDDMLKSEKFNSVITVLIGIGPDTDVQLKKYLETYRDAAKFDHLLYADTDPKSIAKICNLIVSQSVSASQSLQSGSVASVVF